MGPGQSLTGLFKDSPEKNAEQYFIFTPQQRLEGNGKRDHQSSRLQGHSSSLHNHFCSSRLMEVMQEKSGNGA